MSASYPAVGVSTSGEKPGVFLPIDDIFWSEAEEFNDQADIAVCAEECGGKEELDRTFSRLEKKIRRSF